MRKGDGNFEVKPISSRMLHIHIISLPASTAAMYSASVVDSVTKDWSLCWIVIVIKQFWKALYHCYIQAKYWKTRFYV